VNSSMFGAGTKKGPKSRTEATGKGRGLGRMRRAGKREKPSKVVVLIKANDASETLLWYLIHIGHSQTHSLPIPPGLTCPPLKNLGTGGVR
jgi:hypothetical protein